MKEKILVIGGAGFIGSHLCKQLVDLEHYVVSLDNYFTGHTSNHHEGVHYLQGDSADLFNIFGHQPLQFNYIFHFGEYARVEQSFNDYETVMEYNYHSFPTILKFANHSDAKLIYSGSSTKFSIGEDGKSMSPYAYTKAQNTEFLKAYAKWNNLQYAIVYFYNVYGDGEISDGKYATVIAKFLKMVNEGATSVPITQPGVQERNFTHIDDTVDGLIKVMHYGYGDNWGIGNSTGYTMLEVAQMMGVTPEMKPEKPGNRMGGVVHNQSLLDLGWKPKIDLKDYIKERL